MVLLQINIDLPSHTEIDQQSSKEPIAMLVLKLLRRLTLRLPNPHITHLKIDRPRCHPSQLGTSWGR